MNTKQKSFTLPIIVVGAVILAVILVFGTIWMGRSASQDTQSAVRSVSLLYLDELAGRREQVVESNLQERKNAIESALNLMDTEYRADPEALSRYQGRLIQLFSLEKFALVDAEGRLYTARPTESDISDYADAFDFRALNDEPNVSLHTGEDGRLKVIIARSVPQDRRAFYGGELTACFMEIDMEEMLEGVSMQSVNANAPTFCNLYTTQGVPLSSKVLGGQARENNLLDAMARADFERGYSYEIFVEEFESSTPGKVSFAYNGVQQTLSYVPVSGTNWILTYLIQESVISNRISAISDGMLRRSLIQSALTVAVLIALFAFLYAQMHKNAQLTLEKQTSDAENRVRHQALEQRLALQEKLLEQEKQRAQQEKLITALASDYWSVYYLELDRDEGVCYQSHADLTDGFKVGEHFRYLESVTAYANRYITETWREAFLAFVQPDAIRRGLAENRVISFRYMVSRHGRERWEMIRFAGVRHPEDREDHLVHTVGACFTDVDAETRKSLAESQALSDALATAEQANRAKTAFLSNMSHEIRTPMNAIIGLDTIALNDPQTPESTREYLKKIGASAEHLLTLINDILDMSRIESGRMTLRNEEFSFSRLIEAINTLFSGQCQEKGLEYSCSIQGQVDDCYIGDDMKLRQMLINLLGNAVKFTPKGGSVALSVERTAHFDGQTTLRFAVKDTGIGISSDYLPHIFDAFSQEDSSTTNRYGSSGLGLAITKSIVEMMNGNIAVESEKGKGSTFTVTVTLMDAPCGDIVPDQDIHPSDMRVLVVDDDPVACEHARLVLEKAGIAAEVAGSGARALEMVQLHHARHTAYNLILLDWKMPEMDGVETARRIRAIVGRESAIIMLTAYRWDDVLEEALQAGIDSFIPKPLFAGTVLEEFRAALQRKGASGQHVKKAELSGRRVLLAEDVAVNAEIMVMVLEMRGIQAELAENGRIAVDMFRDHPAGWYDAILMDMRMPEMDGLTATRTIRAMARDDAKAIPIIALTANAFDEDVQRSLQAGLNAHLSKPVEPDALFETLETLIKD